MQVVERLQVQHHVRLNEMAEASARIAQQKEDEILRLTHHMQVCLDECIEWSVSESQLPHKIVNLFFSIKYKM